MDRRPTKTFLFVMADGGGNIPAQMAIARRLAARGHAVHVLADRSTAGEAAAAACRFHPFERAPHHNMRDREADLVRDWLATSAPAQLRRLGETMMFGPAALYARDVIATIDRVGPDAVAIDCLLFGAIAAAERSGLPAATLFHFPWHVPVEGFTPLGFGLRPARGPIGRLRDVVAGAVMRRAFQFGLAPLNAARRELGLPPLADVHAQLLRLPRGLVLTSPAFDFVPRGLPASVRYVGPQLDDPAWTTEACSPVPLDDPTPLVLVSLGSTYQRQEHALATAIDAIGTLPARGLVTLGAVPTLDVRPPPNVRLVRAVPHRSALPHAAVLVCHGGHGTVIKALAHGVPVLVLPFGRDQQDNGARAVATGAGLMVPARAHVRRIAQTLTRLIFEPHFRANAARLAATIACEATGDPAVREMERLSGLGVEGVDAG